MVRLTVTSVFVWMQPEAISTSAAIRAMWVNTLMCTAAIARLTLVEIWKVKIRQFKVSLIMNKPLAHSIILRKHNCISWIKTLFRLKFHWFFFIFGISALVLLMAGFRPGDEPLLYHRSFCILPQLVLMIHQCWTPGPGYAMNWLFDRIPSEKC